MCHKKNFTTVLVTNWPKRDTTMLLPKSMNIYLDHTEEARDTLVEKHWFNKAAINYYFEYTLFGLVIYAEDATILKSK